MIYAGIDIGATSIKTGLVTEKGQLIAQERLRTLKSGAPQECTGLMIEAIERMLQQTGFDKKELAGIGAGIPGLTDPRGQIFYAPNLRWQHVPLGRWFERHFKGIGFVADNDADAAAFAEMRRGLLRDVQNGLFVTLGTGIGSSLIVQGRIHRGWRGIGAEIGHMKVGENFYKCACGCNGCLETFSSSKALVRYYKRLVSQQLSQNATGNSGHLRDVNANQVFKAAAHGEREARLAVARFNKYLAIGLSNVVNVLDPQVIVIGGGLSNHFDQFEGRLREQIAKMVMYAPKGEVRLYASQLGNEAGMIGAALMAAEGRDYAGPARPFSR